MPIIGFKSPEPRDVAVKKMLRNDGSEVSLVGVK